MPAARVEQLGVDDRPDRPVDVVGAHPLQERRPPPGPRTSSLANEDWSNSPAAVGGGDALGADRRRPDLRPAQPRGRSVGVAERPRSTPNQLTRSQPAFSPSAASSAASRGQVGRAAQRPAGRPLLAGVDDVVVARVGVERLGRRPRAAGRVRAEAADVHVRHVVLGLAVDDPLGHHLADAAGRGEPVHAEARPRPRSRATAVSPSRNSPSGVNASGAVDHPGDPGVAQRRHPLAGRCPRLGEPVEVGLEQRARRGQRRLVAGRPADLGCADVAADEQRRRPGRRARK